MTRDLYNAIQLSSLPQRTQKMVENLVKNASQAEKIDEHGGWKFGSEFELNGKEKPEGWALNWDLYGVARDCHSRKTLAVIQIREFYRRKAGYYARIRKNYFLLGRNEDGSAFAHPITSRPIHAAIHAARCPVKAAQDWIFGTDYRRVLRQGDMALLPKKPRGRGREISRGTIRVDGEGSHLLNADRFLVQGERIFALNPTMRHTRGVHPLIRGLGWFHVLIGRRADSWSFAQPTID